jgi:hypothetical protein
MTRAILPRVRKIECVQCGRLFGTRAANAKFCGATCKSINHAERKRSTYASHTPR